MRSSSSSLTAFVFSLSSTTITRNSSWSLLASSRAQHRGSANCPTACEYRERSGATIIITTSRRSDSNDNDDDGGGGGGET